MSEHGIRTELRLGDSGYPERLLHLEEPPRVLYCIGDLRALEPGLAVVGARRATPYGLGCTRLFAGWTAAQGVPVISGAAAGCDQAAHRAALESQGSTVAVLGCGADIDYPKSARSLLARLRATQLVVSEVPWGALPTRFAFPRRNRIIAALSVAVLVIEAGLPSGTFSTADAALGLGRTVMAVPGSINSPESRGSNRLIRTGAAMINDVSDLASELVALGLTLMASQPPEVREAPSNALLRMLLADPMRADDIARALTLDITTALRTLGHLELEGRVVRFRDGRYGVPMTP